MFTLTNDDTGRTFEFPSEDAYEAANWWYTNSRKETVFDFCAKHGLDPSEPTDDPYFPGGRKLVDDWHDAATELYARVTNPISDQIN